MLNSGYPYVVSREGEGSEGMVSRCLALNSEMDRA